MQGHPSVQLVFIQWAWTFCLFSRADLPQPNVWSGQSGLFAEEVGAFLTSALPFLLPPFLTTLTCRARSRGWGPDALKSSDCPPPKDPSSSSPLWGLALPFDCALSRSPPGEVFLTALVHAPSTFCTYLGRSTSSLGVSYTSITSLSEMAVPQTSFASVY